MGEGSVKVNPFEETYKTYKTDKQLDFPCMVDVELTNYCNLNCPYCPTGNKTAKRPKGYMTGNVWSIILKELSERKTPVRFVRWGEPTLHPKLYDWIKQAHDAGLLTHINTNGIDLDIDKICESGLDSIKYSLHICKMKQLRGECLSEGFVRSFIFEGVTSDDMYVEVTTYMPENTKDLTKPPDKYSPCSEVLAKLSINWDGTVSACCADYDNKMIVGDIKSKSLAEIWNGHKLNYYRKMLKDMQHAELELCRYCSKKDDM